MSKKSFAHPIRRPVIIADFSRPMRLAAPQTSTAVEPAPVIAPMPKTGLRYNFPEAGEERAGGYSEDGYCFKVTFAAGRLDRTYAMVRAFLEENGYGELPLPKNIEDLRRFKLPPKLRHQLSLFGDNGYVHNPLKILFPIPAGHRGALTLELYNEARKDHLLRFHRLK